MMKSRIKSQISHAFFSLCSNQVLIIFHKMNMAKHRVPHQQVTTTKGSWNFGREGAKMGGDLLNLFFHKESCKNADLLAVGH